MSSNRWSRDELKLAFHLYCQLPFGRLHQRNPEIIQLAGLIGRTPSALAMKLVNFASLDPAITASGRKGLGGASKLDQEVWDQFHADWEGLALECEHLKAGLVTGAGAAALSIEDDLTADIGETRQVIVEQRIKQQFFRKAVLSSYRGKCCMSGLAEPRLLLASHIVPWSQDKANRLNPANGLCLSALHDRAFDQGLIALTDEYTVILSASLRQRDDAFVREVLLPLAGRQIELPERFMPSVELIAWHRERVFVG
ncbi:hypothetical protein D3C85_759160 [compost metagenome]